jgi:hypothetical protein
MPVFHASAILVSSPENSGSACMRRMTANEVMQAGWCFLIDEIVFMACRASFLYQTLSVF